MIRNPMRRDVAKRQPGAVIAGVGIAIATVMALVGSGVAREAHADPAPVTAADVAVCGAFAAIDHLVQESTVPSPGPAGLVGRTYDLVGLANGLNLERQGLSTELDGDVGAYVYSLTEAGAAINHHEPTDLAALTTARDQLTHRCPVS